MVKDKAYWYRRRQELKKTPAYRLKDNARRLRKRVAERAFRNTIPKATHKWCKGCDGIKSVQDFHWQTIGRYRQQICKSCQKIVDLGRAEEKRLISKRYAKANAAKVNAYNALAKIWRRKLSVPKWADLEAIKGIYAEASRLTKETGIKHEVDHVIPLKHPLVCGLHVEVNLRVVTRHENAKKYNTFEIAG